jgi:AcrR family transcriptional regulator
MTSNTYATHRENQRERILEVAEGLFIQDGIDRVTIGNIAKAARLTRATVYKYFSSKEQIAKEIFKTVSQSWVDRHRNEVWNGPGNGHELIERFVTSHLNNLLQNPSEARFIAEFNSLYAKEWPVEEAIVILNETLGEERKRVADAIRQGQTDGSLRADVEPELMLAAFFNFISGINNRLGEMGAKAGEEYSLDTQTIFIQVCRIILDGLKPSNKPGKSES